MIVNLGSLKVCNLLSSKTYKVVRECCRLNVPLKNDAVTVVVGAESCHVVAFLKISLADKLCGAGYLAIFNGSLRLCCVVKSCYDNTVNSYNCCIVDVHLDSSLKVIAGRTVISVVYTKTKNHLALGSEGGSLLIVASLYNCINELADLDGTTCVKKSLVLGDKVVVNLLILKSLKLCCSLADYILLKDSSLLEPLLNSGAPVRSTVSCHVVVEAKLLLGKKAGEFNSITDGVLVLNCIDLTINDYAVLIKNNGCDSCIDLCVGDVTEYDAKTKSVLIGYFGNVVGIGCTALALTLYKVVGVRGNIVRIGRAALALAFYKVMGVRGNIVGVGLTTCTLAVFKAMSVGILATAKYKYEYKYKNKSCSYCAADNSKSLLAEIKGKLGSFGLFLNGSLSFFRLLIVEILHFFAHFFLLL